MNINLNFLNNKKFSVGDIVRVHGVLGIIVKDIDDNYNVLSMEQSDSFRLDKGELWYGRPVTKKELEETNAVELIKKSKDVKITIE